MSALGPIAHELKPVAVIARPTAWLHPRAGAPDSTEFPDPRYALGRTSFL